MKILLIAGHGSGDCGALGNGFEEAKLTRELVNLIAPKLRNYATVDIYDQRRNAYYDVCQNKFNIGLYDYVFEVHFNAFRKDERKDGKMKGTECYVTFSEGGISVEQAIMNRLNKFFPLRDNDNVFDGVKRTNFAVIQSVKNKGMSGALLETCFIDDADDIDCYQKNKNAIAQAIVDGIVEGFMLKQSNTPTPPKPQPQPPVQPNNEMYRVRKSWAEAKSQIGAYKVLDNAKNACKVGYTVYNSKGQAVYTNTPTAPKPTPPQPQTKKVYLPKTATSWRAYPTNVAPVVGNEKGFLYPSKFGGLTYDVLGYPYPNVVTIQTRDYGKVNIYVAPTTGAVIK